MTRAIILFAMLTFTIQCLGQTGRPSYPNNVAGNRAKAFMAFLASTDDDGVRAFLTAHVVTDKSKPFAKQVEDFKDTRKFLSGSELRKIVSVSDEAIVFIIKTSRGSFGRVSLKLAADDQKIIGIDVERVPESALGEKPKGPVKKLSGKQAAAELGKYLDELYEKDEFSGAVMIAKNGKPFFTKAYGYADKKSQRTNRIDTKFNIGSINKLFTMLAIGMLADEGKLSFSDTIGKHLPDYPNKKAREKATIKHLLTMSSGIGDIFGPEFEATPKSKLRTINAYLPLFASKPLSFEPGKGRQYSNGGFLVLGAIIEKTSGQSYYDFVRERIYKPIGMNDTDAYEVDAKIRNLANGYLESTESKERASNLSTLPARGSSGGGGYSTAGDLLKFANALETGSFKTPNSLKNSTDQILNGLANGGLRFAGGAPGINAMVLNRIGEGYTIIVLSNYSPPSASNVARYIRDRLE